MQTTRIAVTIGLASMAVLLYEVAITRVLSVVLWYHFAFLSISLALLGLGAPGVWFALRGAPKRGVEGALAASAIAMPLSVVVITKIVGSFPRTESADASATSLLGPGVLVTVAAMLVPFLALGAAVCLLLMQAPGRAIGRAYGADLLGATLGAALVVPLLSIVPTPQLLAGAGLLPLGALALYGRGPARVALGLGALLVASLVWGEPYRLHYTKKYDEGDRLLYEKWTPTGRITIFPDVFYETNPSAAFAWGIGERWEPRNVPQLWIEQDGSAGTPITKQTGSPDDLAHLFYDVTSFGYQLGAPERVCIIGAGGGRDILAAKLAGAAAVDAVELNPAIVDAVSDTFREFSGDVYGLPGVNAITSEGRSFLTRTPHRYDFLQISMVDSWAATSAGAFALSENYLYTREAFQLYWDRIDDDGFVSVSRWMMDRHLVEGARLVMLAKAALAASGVAQPLAHIVVVQAKAVANIVLSKRPVDDALLARVDAVCAERGFFRHWPVHEGTPSRSLMPRLLSEGPEFMEASGLDLSPPTDDRPFYFQAVPVFGSLDHDLIAKLSVNEQSVLLLRRLLWVVGGLSLVLFFVPFAIGSRLPRAPALVRGSAYFACIGLAFLLVEAAWVQRFILFLGHPSYATTVVIAAVLLGAGAGSWHAGRTSLDVAARFGLVVPAFLVAVNEAMAPLFQHALGLPFPLRILVSVALLVPTGYGMGFALPLGMIRFGDAAKPWYWAMNGAFSVFGSVCSLALAMAIGHHAVAWIGVGAYLLAYALFLRPAQAATP